MKKKIWRTEDFKDNPFFREWNILGLHPSASAKDIKKRHRELSMIHHPDRGGEPSKMAAINQAKDFLLKWYSRFAPEDEEGETMEKKINLDPEFMSLIPPLSLDERERLEQSLIEEGCRDPLILWDDILIDGHHRYDICLRHEIPFKTIVKGFDDREQAKLWVIRNQLARRNLTSEQTAYLRGEEWKLTEKQPGERTDLTSDQNEPRLTKLESIAEKHGVSPATIKRDSKYAEAIDRMPEEEKKEILSGKSKKSKKEIIGEEKKKLPKLGPPSNGIRFAKTAIWQLEQIKDDDLEKEEAFDSVRKYIEERVIAAEAPVKFKKYLERLRRAWEIIPKRSVDFNNGQRMYIESYAGQIFGLLETFIKVRPSDEFFKRFKK